MLDFSVVNESGSALHAANPTVIKIIGCGGGGSSAVNRMIESGVCDVEFVVLNTDLQALNTSLASKRLAIGQKLTGGLGAGGNPQVGEDAAREDTEMITNVVKGADMVIITAGMGGGTGTGSAPIVAQIAREQGALTIAVVTTPFTFEGAVRMKFAEQGLDRLRESVDSLIVIPNQQVMKIVDKKLSFSQAFRIADNVLCQGVQGISEIITKAGAVNIDFADVKSVMMGQGDAILGVGNGEGENRAIDAATEAISNPMLENRQIDGARNILVNITSSEDLAMTEVEEIVNTIKASADSEVRVFWGQVINPEMDNKVSVTVIATGFVSSDDESAVPSREAAVENSDVMSQGVFEKVLQGKNLFASRDEVRLDDPVMVRSTSFGNPGQFDSHANKNMDIPHENAPMNEEGKREGTYSEQLVNASRLERSIEPPAGMSFKPDDYSVPACWRTQQLSRAIDLSSER